MILYLLKGPGHFNPYTKTLMLKGCGPTGRNSTLGGKKDKEDMIQITLEYCADVIVVLSYHYSTLFLSQADGSEDTETYVYLSYGTVEYHKLLNQVNSVIKEQSHL